MSEETINQVISQVTKIASTDKNQKKLKELIIDPLVVYLKQRIKLFYLLITILLLILVISNVYIIYNIKNILSFNKLPVNSSNLLST
jgi:hypothetical protein